MTMILDCTDLEFNRLFLDGQPWQIDFPKGLMFRTKGPNSIKAELIAGHTPGNPLAEWNGEGLPPVGAVCEIRAHKLTEWSKAEIKFASRNVVVWDWVNEPALHGHCTGYRHNVEIRAIRTPEQISAEEAEKAVEKMFARFGGPNGLTKLQCIWVISEGYRKIEQP